MPNLPRIPSHSTLSYLLLVLTAVSGEYPTAQVIRLPGGRILQAKSAHATEAV